MHDDDDYHKLVSDQQIKRAEDMLGDMSFDMFIEKRSRSGQFRPGQLLPLGKQAEAISVMVSEASDSKPKQRVLISNQSIPALQDVTLSFERAGQRNMIEGRVSESRTGRRKADLNQGSLGQEPLHVAMFHAH